jgi:hypothetical protein
MEDEVEDSGQLKGVVIDPDLYLKVINHDLRKQILNRLFILSLEKPISKSTIADDLDIGYHKMLYQLTQHLKYFWKVDYEKKVRGAREEYISPKWMNSVFCLLGGDAAVHILDPLANIYVKLAEVVVRCDNCTESQNEECMSSARSDPCMPQTEDVVKKREIILMVNERSDPYKPLDLFLICTLIKSLENEPCTIDLSCDKYTKRT